MSASDMHYGFSLFKIPGQFKRNDLWQLVNWTDILSGKPNIFWPFLNLPKKKSCVFIIIRKKKLRWYIQDNSKIPARAGRPLAGNSKLVKINISLYRNFATRKNLIRLIEAFNLTHFGRYRSTTRASNKLVMPAERLVIWGDLWKVKE